MSKAAVLFSGGLDSVVVASQLAASGQDLCLLCANLGKPLVVEYARQVAFAIARKYDVYITFDAVDLSSVYDLLKRNMKDKYVPGYRMICNLIGLAYADSCEVHAIHTGEMYSGFSNNWDDAKDDPEGFDMRKTFYVGKAVLEQSCEARQKLVEAYRSAYWPDAWRRGAFYSVDAPHFYMTKPERIILAKRLGAPIDLSFTCVGALEPLQEDSPTLPSHCGKTTCYFCNQRRLAFAIADLHVPHMKLQDPSHYLRDEPMGEAYVTFYEEYRKEMPDYERAKRESQQG